LSTVLDGGLKCCEEIYDKPSENIIYAFLHHIAGTAEEGKGNFLAAEKFLLIAEKSRRSRENVDYIIEDDLVATVNNLGLVYNSLNQFKKAKDCFLECVELLKQRPQTLDRDMTIVMSDHNVARCTMQAGELENARPLLEAQHAFYLKSSNWWMLAK
jgi:tetratricopeptide (TPR) repeat protein